jgi:hypothetical protein
MDSFTEWYVCYPVKHSFPIKLRCVKTDSFNIRSINESKIESKLVPVCRFQPKFMKEFILKYKYYDDTKASIETDIKA